MMIVCMPEPQTLLTVVAWTEVGRPALMRGLAGRGLAEPGGKHAAHVDAARSSSPVTPARSTAAVTAVAPRSVAETSASAPCIPPIGVRA